MKANFVELWRRHTLAYEPIRRIVGSNVYPQHISGVMGAQFPALSIFTLGAPSYYGIINGLYQVDSWSLVEEEARHLQDYLEDIWTPDSINSLPSSAGVKVLFLRQANRFDGGYEPEEKLYHKVSIYGVRWKAL
jgi:hypothetical protein